MLFKEINIKDLLEKGEKIYYYNKWFYAHIRRQNNPLEGTTLFLKKTILDFKTILLIFDRIIIPISHILTLVHKNEIAILQKLFNNNFVKNLIDQGLIIFSIWHTNESLSPEYFIEINKEYLTASGWSLKDDWYIPIQHFPINNEKLYIYKRPLAKQSEDFKNFYIQTLDFLTYSGKLEINKKKLEEIQKAINDGVWTIKTPDAYIPFSMEKFFYDIKIKEEFKYWNSKDIKLSFELAKSAYYKAGETGNGGLIFLPLDLNDEIAINRTTYNNEIYAFLLSPYFLQKLASFILDINFSILLERVTAEKLILLRTQQYSKHCFKKFQKFFICFLKQISKFIDLETFKTETSINEDKLVKNILEETKNFIIRKEERGFLKRILQILVFLMEMVFNRDFNKINRFIDVFLKKIVLQYYDSDETLEFDFKCSKHIVETIMSKDNINKVMFNPIIPLKK